MIVQSLGRFKGLADIDNLVKQSGDVAYVKALLAGGTLHASDRAVVRQWLAVHDHDEQEEQRRVSERGTTAAERQATAAERSALLAAIAVGISLVALAVSVAAYIKPPDLKSGSPPAAPISASPKAGTSPPNTPTAAP